MEIITEKELDELFGDLDAGGGGGGLGGGGVGAGYNLEAMDMLDAGKESYLKDMKSDKDVYYSMVKVYLDSELLRKKIKTPRAVFRHMREEGILDSVVFVASFGECVAMECVINIIGNEDRELHCRTVHIIFESKKVTDCDKEKTKEVVDTLGIIANYILGDRDVKVKDQNRNASMLEIEPKKNTVK